MRNTVTQAVLTCRPPLVGLSDPVVTLNAASDNQPAANELEVRNVPRQSPRYEAGFAAHIKDVEIGME